MDVKSNEIINDEYKGSIKAIDQRSVHQICSGQVILSLATAVKELVENSIDAGANNMEIKLKEFGMESIEVYDNGSGIEEKDFDAIALKHCTSKLRDFSDLMIVETFGFRGEALSSLCALSKLIIITRHQSKEFGSKLEFDYDGRLVSKTPCAREIGTTIIVNQLFHTLPVRHKEFQRNIKKEFPKLSSVLQAYGIINTNVRINCINFADKNRKTIVLSTPGSESFIENIASIFGPKQIQSLLPFAQQDPTEDVLDFFNISSKSAVESKGIFTINGFVSRIDHGCGRSSLDRQFYYINKRPCDFAKISRLVNEVYHMFNRSQNPFVFLNISLNSELVDVNITPDKRQIFIQNEKFLLAIIKTSLLQMYTETAGQYELNMKQKDRSNDFNSCMSKQSDFNASPLCTASSSSERSTDPVSQEEETSSKRQPKMKMESNTAKAGILVSSVLSKFKSRFSKEQTSPNMKNSQISIEKFTYAIAKDDVFRKEKVKKEEQDKADISTDENDLSEIHAEQVICRSLLPSNVSILVETENQETEQRSRNVYEQKTDNIEPKIEVIESSGESMRISKVSLLEQVSSKKGNDEECFVEKLVVDGEQEVAFENEREHCQIGSNNGRLVDDMKCRIDDKVCNAIEKEHVLHTIKSVGNSSNKDEKTSILKLNGVNCNEDVERSCKRQRFSRPETQLRFDMDELRSVFDGIMSDTITNGEGPLLGFHARITASQNNAAEEELRKNITKEMFKEMDIIGQFNLGFIIAKIHDNLFIIDQHASDEKYNFETLQKEHCLKGQRLIQPRPLELTPVNESILIDNLNIFKQNGFEFLVDENQLSGRKVKLITLPTSRNWTFGVQDIEELIFMLSDNPGIMCRPSRVRSMFASRACRMSTMVGSALNLPQMKTLLDHMAEIEHPWNCPHGRPTMRHLVNLHRLSNQFERSYENEF